MKATRMAMLVHMADRGKCVCSVDALQCVKPGARIRLNQLIASMGAHPDSLH